MTNKQLAKISKATFGIGGYQDAMLGLWLSFSWPGGGVSPPTESCWAYGLVDPSKNSKWTEAQRTATVAKMMEELCGLLAKAKVQTVDELVGIPVEITFDQGRCVGFRVLEEVL
jgi:hypothetical protein